MNSFKGCNEQNSQCELPRVPWVCPSRGAPDIHPTTKQRVWMETVKGREICSKAGRDHNELPAEIYPQEDVLRNRGALSRVQPRLDSTISTIHVPQKMLPWPQGKEESHRFTILEIREQARVDRRRYHHFLHIRRFSNLFKKRNLNTKYFLSFSFFREILVNALNKTEPIYTQICMYIATLLGDVVFCRSPLLFHRTRQLSWSQRGFTVNFWTLFRGTALISNLAEVFLPTETVHLLSVSFIPLTDTFLLCFDFYKLGDLWSRCHLTVLHHSCEYCVWVGFPP